jgi:hypothetical protein
MSAPLPLHINELPVGTALADADVFVATQGSVDKQFSAATLKDYIFDWDDLTEALNVSAIDYVLIQQGTETKKAKAYNFFFPIATRMYFFQSVAPPGWVTVGGLGDTLLSVAGGGTYTTAGTVQGNWQMPDHTLTIFEIPPHIHTITGNDDIGHSSTEVARGKTGGSSSRVYDTSSNGFGLPHNHGAGFRPASCVGIICQKVV